jgi:t-SNARE complex subunit (syntaxin)
MNITKEFHDYMNYNTNLMISPYKFKYEKYSPMHKCSRLFRQIKEIENKLDQLLSISKKSSSFNNSHLKFSSATVNIKQSLVEVENEMKKIKEKDLYLSHNNFSKQIINNSLDILNQKTSDISNKFQKFLQTQAETIRRIEKRKIIITNNNSSKKINNYNEYTINYDNNKNNNEDDEDVLLNITGQAQTTMKRDDQYYSYRLNAAQGIEKMMGEISGMTNRLSQMVYEHSLMIENISQNTDIALGNVERGSKEIKDILENVKGNRSLLLRIFFIIIVVSVIYILFFA